MFDDDAHQETTSPELRQIDLNRVSVRSRAQSIKHKDPRPSALDLGAHIVAESGVSIPKSPTRKVSEMSAKSYPTPSPTSSYHGDSDPTEKLPHLVEQYDASDTVLESEGFTMIDLDSIHSARQVLSSPAEDNMHGQTPTDNERSSTKPSEPSSS